MKLKVLPLDAESFAPYGDVIETAGRDFFHINNGLVERYHALGKADILKQDQALISINRAEPLPEPLMINVLERHPLGSQAFFPLNGESFVMVVATGEQEPDPESIRAFITNGRQGVNYYRNVWHYPLFAWQTTTDFLTIDRGGNDNCDVATIATRELVFR